MQMLAIESCPRCGNKIEREISQEIFFCSRCKFPLILVAGKYLLLDELDEGGFGTIYKAKHIYLKKDALRAIKIIHPKRVNPTLKKRFYREVQITSSISMHNEHIVRIYDDFGEIPNYSIFYVMEYLRGKPLTKYILEVDPLPLDWILHIFGQLCNAINAIHQRGIIHRDLKPENLFLIKQPQNPYFLKVIDFGIAKPINTDKKLTSLTQGLMGSPHYISPER